MNGTTPQQWQNKYNSDQYCLDYKEQEKKQTYEMMNQWTEREEPESTVFCVKCDQGWANLFTIVAMYFPWCSARASSVSLGSLIPSPANTPAPYGEPPRIESILNIPAPKVYPIGTKSIPWWANWVIAVHLCWETVRMCWQRTRHEQEWPRD